MSVNFWQAISALFTANKSSGANPPSVKQQENQPADMKYFGSLAETTTGVTGAANMNAWHATPVSSGNRRLAEGASNKLDFVRTQFPDTSGITRQFDGLINSTAERINVTLGRTDAESLRNDLQKLGYTGPTGHSDLEKIVKLQTAANIIDMTGGDPAEIEHFFYRPNHNNSRGLRIVVDTQNTDSGIKGQASPRGVIKVQPYYFFANAHDDGDDVLTHELAHMQEFHNDTDAEWNGKTIEIPGATSAEERSIRLDHQRLLDNPSLQTGVFPNNYAATNPREFWAEARSAYRLGGSWRENLRKNFPDTHALISKLRASSNGPIVADIDNNPPHGHDGHVHTDGDGHTHDHDHVHTDDDIHVGDDNSTAAAGDTPTSKDDLRTRQRKLKQQAKDKGVWGKYKAELNNVGLDIFLTIKRNTGGLHSINERLSALEQRINDEPELVDADNTTSTTVSSTAVTDNTATTTVNNTAVTDNAADPPPVVADPPVEPDENTGTYDDMSFGDAFAAAMKDKGEGEIFTYKGKDILLKYA